MFARLLTLLNVIVLAACDQGRPVNSPVQVTVFAAASTTDVMREAGRRFEATAGIRVVFSFDASSSLARQIKLGSPADVYISADQRWMDDVESAGAVRAGTRQDLLANDLVVVAPVGRAFDLTVSSDFEFTARLPQVRRIAVGDPSHVPAGRYARQALESLDWWDALEPLLVPAQDVRAALRLVEIGEADAGIVYATDAAASSRVVIVAAIGPDLHEPIHYPVALCSDTAAAAEFAAFLRTAEMDSVFRRAGFRVIAPPSPRPLDAATAGGPR